jgi:pyruvate/2-oxoglutarate/acetoin dehydrogenase E1 component
MFEHAMLLNTEDELPAAPPGSGADSGFDIDHAAVRRKGRDLSIVTYGGSLPRCLDAAQSLAATGIEAEVLDLRVLRPLDREAIAATLARTRRLLVVDEGWKTCSLAAEIIAIANEDAFYDLDAPPARVCSAEVPMPYARHLEEAALPNPGRIVAAARALVEGTR